MQEINEIYVDNYRGFTDTSIPLESVNFLVGENSTGKTSILKLIDLVASSDLWFNGEFRNGNVDFSYYGDLAENLHKSRTKIGVLFGDKRNNDNYSFVKMILRSGANNRTTISSIHAISDGMEYVILVQPSPEKTIKYQIGKYNKALNPKEFKAWCKKTETFDNVKEYDTKKDRFFRENSPYFLIQKAMSLHDNPKDKDSILAKPPSFLNTFSHYSWIAPIRIKPQQTYDGNVYEYSPDGAHTPYKLRDIFDKKKTQNSLEVLKSLEEFGEISGLFDTVKSKRYSKEGNAPFSIDVVLDSRTRHITEVGYGVSQVLPILISVLDTQYAGHYEIQQPEVHLHPRAQASLGNLFYQVSRHKGTQFIIETHSDFLIDRFRQQVSSNPNDARTSAQVLFFQKTKGKNTVSSIPINQDGTYSEKQPEAFRSFFLNEEMKNLAI